MTMRASTFQTRSICFVGAFSMARPRRNRLEIAVLIGLRTRWRFAHIRDARIMSSKPAFRELAGFSINRHAEVVAPRACRAGRLGSARGGAQRGRAVIVHRI